MKHIKFCLAIACVGLLLTAPAQADTLGTAIGGGVGAVAGAMLGDAYGGRNAIFIGSGVGGALGAVVGQSVSTSAYAAQAPGYGSGYKEGHGRPRQVHHHHYHGKTWSNSQRNEYDRIEDADGNIAQRIETFSCRIFYTMVPLPTMVPIWGPKI